MIAMLIFAFTYPLTFEYVMSHLSAKRIEMFLSISLASLPIIPSADVTKGENVFLSS